jgi:hypothetical protein
VISTILFYQSGIRARFSRSRETCHGEEKEKKKEMSEKYEEKKRNPKKEETLERALQTKALIKDEKVLYSQNF